MFDFIEGVVEGKTPEAIVINVQGVGFELLTSATTLSDTSLGERVRTYTYMHVREDALLLFGFVGREERAMFLKLIAISGVGPKLALAVLSTLRPTELAAAVVLNDTQAIVKVPGVGKKTAERIVLELREKVDYQGADLSIAQSFAEGDLASQAAAALVALGYSSEESVRAVAAADVTANATIEELIMGALRRMGS